MKTLLQINSVVNTGSTGRIAEGIGQIAMENGWQSHIAFGRKSNASRSKLIRIGSDFDNIFHGIQTRLFDSHGFASRHATKKLIAQIKEINPDIIHLHNIHGYYVNIELLFQFLSKLKTPVAWTFHDCWSITGHCSHFDYIGCNRWKTGCYSCPQTREYPKSLLCDHSKKNYALKKQLFTSVKNITLVPVSKWLGNILSESYLNKFSLKVIYNGIDINVFKPMETKSLLIKYKLQNKFIILGVANIWGSKKGLNDFVNLSKRLNDNYKIILVGLTNKQINNLPSSILGITKTESVKELATFYSAAGVFVNPTWEDNFPTTNLEALACGTPVITYNTGGSPESITNKTGFVVEKGDIQALIRAINEIKQNGKKFYSDACRKRAVEYFDKNKRFKEYLELYEQLLK